MHIVPRFKDDGFSWVEPEISISKSDFIDLPASLVEKM